MSPQGIFILIFFTIVVLSVIWAQKSRPRQRHHYRGGISRELLQATKGDRELAERLLNYARNKYPGKSERWYLEKVLYDLERDGAGGASSAREFRRNRQVSRKSSPFAKWWQRLFRR